jgi:hypothetical protein
MKKSYSRLYQMPSVYVNMPVSLPTLVAFARECRAVSIGRGGRGKKGVEGFCIKFRRVRRSDIYTQEELRPMLRLRTLAMLI